MAVCKFCEREMLTADGCICVPVKSKGKEYEPIKVGGPGDWYESRPDGRCGDCNAKYGEYHHAGCDIERCPVCGGQLISCGCLDLS